MWWRPLLPGEEWIGSDWNLAIIDLCPVSSCVGGNFIQTPFPSVSVQELDRFIHTIDLAEQLSRINPEIRRSKSIKRFFKRILALEPPPITSDRIKAERNRIFAMALKPFDDGFGACPENNDRGREWGIEEGKRVSNADVVHTVPNSDKMSTIGSLWRGSVPIGNQSDFKEMIRQQTSVESVFWDCTSWFICVVNWNIWPGHGHVRIVSGSGSILSFLCHVNQHYLT